MTHETRRMPALTLGHVTLAVRDIDRMVGFYCGTLGFHVTNRGQAPDGAEMAFLCQDPTAHHQIVLIEGMPTPEHQFVLADHMAFRTGTLDDLRSIAAGLADAGIEGVIPISHGNAWSLYFNDPEGNGLECFVDTPFHVAQPYAGGVDLDSSDEEITAATRAEIESMPEFGPFEQWRAEFAARLEAEG